MAVNYQPNPAAPLPLNAFGPGGVQQGIGPDWQSQVRYANGGYQPPTTTGSGVGGPGRDPTSSSGGSGNEQQQLQQAMAALGISGTQMRNDPSAQQRVQQYLAQNGSPGWQFGGTQAGDWAQTPSGQQVDYLSSQGDRFQWINDPANGQGGGNNAMPGPGLGTGLGNGQASPYGGVATNAPLLQPFSQTFHAPTAEQAMQSPGLQFAMDEAQKALQRSAAAKGTLLTGGLLKGLQGTAIGQSLQGYGDVYNRALGEFNLGRDIFETNQGKQYNRLLGVSQLGENAASQTGAYGSQYAQNAGNLTTEQGNAQAAGSLGGTIPWANAFTGIGNQYLENMYLKQLGPSNIYGQ